ncbi:hypothetical protein CL618_02200 [archaeon]|nr:hypothetical protein [archaeon]|tara:strand:- start:5090 stop:5713 length:624 start_codon:yes stop_codon:yes gene_type:complete
MRFIKPKLELEKDIEDASWAYFSKNFLVRWIYYLRLKKSLNLVTSKGKKILDIGTGCGVLLPSLSLDNDVKGIDLDEKFLEKAKKLELDVKLEKVDIEKGLEGKYDVIFALSVMEHVKDLDFVFGEIKNSLSENGILIVGVPVENIFVKSFFKLMKVGDVTEEEHVSDYREIEKKLKEKFNIEKVKKIPFDYFFDGLSVYKIWKCRK